MEMFEIEEICNPLDSVEDLLSNNDWVFDRPNPEELAVTVTGRAVPYRMTFLWQEDYNAMQFFCEVELDIPSARRDDATRAMQDINARLWLGHFILSPDTGLPCFRHTCLFRDTQGSGADLVEDLIDIAIGEADRYVPLFTLLAEHAAVDDALVRLALAESAGAA